MFIQNKYTKIYFKIIDNAKNRKLTSRAHANIELGYSELHHIIPKSISKDNSKENTIFLTSREHFICHWLLTKMTTDEYKGKMIYALRRMKSTSQNQQRYYTAITSRVFAKLKKLHALEVSQRHRGKTISDETKAKMSAAAKGRTFSDETKAKMSAAKIGNVPVNKGMPMSIETKTKLSIARKGAPGLSGDRNGMYGVIPWNKNKKWSEETRAKMSESAKKRHQKNKENLP